MCGGEPTLMWMSEAPRSHGFPQHLIEIEHRDVLPRVGPTRDCRATAGIGAPTGAL